MRILKSVGLAAALAMSIGLVGFPAASHAATYVQTSDGCSGSGGCGIDTNNKVVVSTTATADVYQIAVTLDTGWLFMKDPNGNGHEATFVFSDSASGLTISNIVSNGGSSFSTTSNPTHMAPLTFPATAYGLSNANQKTGTSLTFNVTTTDSTLALFLASLQAATGEGDTPLFAADVYSGTTGNTGVIDFSLSTVSTVPLPPAALLFGSALIGLGVLGRRRRKDGFAQA
jgi:hypothetical protein